MQDQIFLSACGLYCGACDAFAKKQCEGCGKDCDCGQCTPCNLHDGCAIHKCVTEKGFQTCAECRDVPCTMLIEFTNDQLWPAHRAAIENQHRRAKIGYEAWLAEEKEYWKDPEKLEKYHYAIAEYAAKMNEFHAKRDLFKRNTKEE